MIVRCLNSLGLLLWHRNQSLPYALSYPMKGGEVDTMGSWPVQYHGTPCPVGDHKLQYQFLNYSTPVHMSTISQPCTICTWVPDRSWHGSAASAKIVVQS